jgi:hypothetical protein
LTFARGDTDLAGGKRKGGRFGRQSKTLLAESARGAMLGCRAKQKKSDYIAAGFGLYDVASRTQTA